MLPILLLLLAADAKPWKAGVAVRAITPEGSMWMAGYGGRNSPSEGTLTDLHAKVLVLEDEAERPVAQQAARRLAQRRHLLAGHPHLAGVAGHPGARGLVHQLCG